MNAFGTVPAYTLASTGLAGATIENWRLNMIRLNLDAVRSYAVAGAASLYCAVMFLAAVGPNNAAFSGFIA
jgi:hypothetical protein